MDLYKLKYFHSVAETLSFSEAAKKCLVSQSAMSQSIALLEISINAKLFKREGKTIVLTQTGQTLFKHTEAIFRSVNSASAEISNITKEIVGDIKIATQANIGIYLLLDPIKKWIKKYPKTNLIIKYENKQQCLELLRGGKIDVAIVPQPPSDKRLNAQTFYEDAWTFVCSTKHPLAKLKKAGPKDLNNYSIMVPSRNKPRQKDFMQKALEKRGAYPKIQLEANNAEALKQMTIQNFGYSILPRRMIQKEIQKKQLKDLKISGLVISHSISILSLNNSSSSYASKKFCDYLISR